MGAIAYLGCYYDHAGDALSQLKRIEAICNADNAIDHVEIIFKKHTTIETLERTYKERIHPYEGVI